MNIKIDLSTSGITQEVREVLRPDAEAAKAKLWSGNEDFTGWVDLPRILAYGLASGPGEYDQAAGCPEGYDLVAEYDELKKTTEEIRGKCDLFIVVGIGGSYMGAKCVIDALAPHKISEMGEVQPLGTEPVNSPEVIFAGCNMSAAYHMEVIKKMREKETCLCVISKSGGTTEPLAAFSILKEEMIAKYGEDASSRIYAITDKEKGRLRPEADAAGYKTFIVPDDIGGRYSVLTPVGLLPIAVAGMDIDALVRGAADMAEEFCQDAGQSKSQADNKDNNIDDNVDDNKNDSKVDIKTNVGDLADYAISRVALSKSGKWIEIFEYFHPELDFFAEWLKQLFGESEGKEGKGIFPASLMFSRDLHSMGQFIQQGKQMFFETMIIIEDRGADIVIPESAGEPLAGKSLEQINDCAIKGVAAAHTKAGVPVIKITLPEMNEYNMGQLLYFFEMTCGIAAYMAGVNPFDQPGVEAYKEEMRQEIEKL